MEFRKIKHVFGTAAILCTVLFVNNAVADAVVVEDVNFDGIPDIETVPRNIIINPKLADAIKDVETEEALLLADNSPRCWYFFAGQWWKVC